MKLEAWNNLATPSSSFTGSLTLTSLSVQIHKDYHYNKRKTNTRRYKEKLMYKRIFIKPF